MVVRCMVASKNYTMADAMQIYAKYGRVHVTLCHIARLLLQNGDIFMTKRK